MLDTPLHSSEPGVIEDAALWQGELGFSNWLHGNIHLLADVIGTSLVSRQREARVGRLSADILAEISGTGEPVIIENQIYPANHGHFGQVFTYAAHYDAATIIWIATHFRDEYRSAISWLNTLSSKRFFAVELRSGGGAAPTFEIVAGPDTAFDDFVTPQRTIMPVSTEARGSTQRGSYVPSPFAIPAERMASPGQLVLNSIFERMTELLTASRAFPRLRRPTGDRNYYVVSAGPVRGSEWAVTFEDAQVGVALVFDNAETAAADLERVRRHEAEISAAVGYPIDCSRVQSRIKQKAILYRPVTYEQRSQEGDEIAHWCVETIATFAAVVQRLVTFELH